MCVQFITKCLTGTSYVVIAHSVKFSSQFTRCWRIVLNIAFNRLIQNPKWEMIRWNPKLMGTYENRFSFCIPCRCLSYPISRHGVKRVDEFAFENVNDIRCQFILLLIYGWDDRDDRRRCDFLKFIRLLLSPGHFSHIGNVTNCIFHWMKTKALNSKLNSLLNGDHKMNKNLYLPFN